MAVAARRPLPQPVVPPSSQTNHTAGIYADMTVDGPEIGTLVVVVDRAKNLPNLRTMGKQDPYCAARLAKEAKKTDTDKRGGQTPRWDQELRFIVRDSPDYLKLKVSVFNDDKKTDLIGETWVHLDELIQPGGGQGDDWHPLNIKGRYAGEIRMELTYYDSRPKVEKPKERKRSSTNSTQASSTQFDHNQARPAGPQPMNRRPLPPEPPFASTATLSMHPPGPHQHNHLYDDEEELPTPPEYHDNDLGYGIQAPYPMHNLPSIPPPIPHSSRPNMRPHQASTAPQVSSFQPPASYHTPIFQNDFNDHQPIVDDPHVLEQRYSQQQNSHYPYQQPSPPRHDRVQLLSGTSASRPLPPYELPHTHSAPELGPEAYSQPSAPYASHSRDIYNQNDMYDSLQSERSRNDFPSYSAQPPGVQNYPDEIWLETSNNMDDDRPPPPPVHRNSAPPAPCPFTRPTASQQTNTPTRSLHVATNTNNMPYTSSGQPPSSATHRPPGHTYGPVSTSPYPSSPIAARSTPPRAPLRKSDTNQFQHHLSPSADQIMRPRNEMASDPRFREDEASTNPHQHPQGFHGASTFENKQPTAPTHGQHNATHQNRDVLNSSNPQAVRPGVSNPVLQGSSPRHQTPRKSVGASASPADSQNSTPYSPDSFDVLNPNHSHHSTPSNTGTKKSEPVPMYSSPSSSPTKSPLQNSPSTQERQPEHSNEPIIGSDGRIKDPTDHLPLSSYAPEPERKGNRPSTVVNIKSRFGPRQAPTSIESNSQPNSIPASSPLSDVRNGPTTPIDTPLNRPRASTGQMNSASSPLSPTQSSILNMSNGSYNLSSPYPPPVPGKIPLGGYQRQVDEYDHFEMAALSLDDSADPQADDKARKRRSRWGF